MSSSFAGDSNALHAAELKRRREFYVARSWGNAYRSLSLANTIEPRGSARRIRLKIG